LTSSVRSHGRIPDLPVGSVDGRIRLTSVPQLGITGHASRGNFKKVLKWRKKEGKREREREREEETLK